MGIFGLRSKKKETSVKLGKPVTQAIKLGRQKQQPVSPRIIVYAKSPNNGKKDPSPVPINTNNDVLRLSQFEIVNNNFEPQNLNGISSFRPEIISVMDFKPIFETNKLNATNIKTLTSETLQLINVQHQASKLREFNLNLIIKDIENNSSFSGDLNKLSTKFTNNLTNIRKIVNYYSSLLQKMDFINESLDIKNISNSFYGDEFLTLKEFYDKFMQYSPEEYDSFSETKIYNQLVFDFRSVLENYSFSLFNTVDEDRINDFNPIKIDKTYSLNDNGTFIPKNFSSVGIGINASETSFFSSFISSLPPNPDDKIKFLCNFLSKELRVSKGLGRTDLQKILQQTFEQGSYNNPFDNIFGEVGETIFEQPLGTNSLASLSYVNTDNFVVLPLENIYIDSSKDNENKVFVPGTVYFGNSIVDFKTNDFNIDSFVNYSNSFNKVVSNATVVLQKMFELDEPASKLTQKKVYDNILTSLGQSIVNIRSNTQTNKEQVLISALFNLCSKDNVLKNYVFDLIILLGFSTNSNIANNSFFNRLKIEIPTVNSLNSFKDLSKNVQYNITNNPSSLKKFVDDLSQLIENRVFELIFNQKYINTDNKNRKTSVFALINSRFRDLNLTSDLYNIPQNKLDPFFHNFNANNEIDRFFIDYGEIKEILIKAFSTQSNSNTNILKEIIELIILFDNSASQNGKPIYVLEDGTNRTRYNSISGSTLLLALFEIFTSFINKTIKSNFERTTNKNIISIINGANNNAAIYQFIRDIVDIDTTQKITIGGKLATAIVSPSTSISKPFNSKPKDKIKKGIKKIKSIFKRDKNSLLIKNNSLSTTKNVSTISSLFANIDMLPINFTINLISIGTSIKNIKEKLNAEDVYITNAVNIFSTINKRLLNVKNEIVNNFSKVNIQNFNAENNITTEELKILKNPAQLKTTAWSLDKYSESIIKNNSNKDKFVINNTIPDVYKNAMLLLLKETKYLSVNEAEQRVKLFTVGIPSGLSKNLSDRIEKKSITKETFRQKEFDVISLNVFKRDARYDDLVFKPKKYIFDLSIFPNQIDQFPNIEIESTWIKILQSAFLKDYQNLSNKINVGFNTINSNEKYFFLNNEEKQQLIRNHMESSFLNTYIQFLTGFDFSEETFTNIPVSLMGQTNEDLYNLILKYLRVFKNTTINEKDNIQNILLSNNVSDETKDIIKLLTCGNVMFQPEAIRNKILSPKMFERVFTVAVDIEDFEIDVDKTIMTESGRDAYIRSYEQGILKNINEKVFLTKRDKNDLVFDDYFITIENNT